ncbi:MAG: acetylxylan esterase, partial [Bacteroidota bacterium]
MFRDHYYLLYSIANELFFTGFLCFLSVASVAQNAGLKLTLDRPDARYQVGETIQIRVEGRDGIADYRIWQDERTPIFASGTVRITNGLGTITYVADRPDLLLCQISQNNQIADIAFTVDPFDIEAFTDEPADFDEFWDAAKTELSQVPMNPQVRFHSSDNHSTTYRINLGNINNRRVYGYLSIPKGSGPF